MPTSCHLSQSNVQPASYNLQSRVSIHNTLRELLCCWNHFIIFFSVSYDFFCYVSVPVQPLQWSDRAEEGPRSLGQSPPLNLRNPQNLVFDALCLGIESTNNNKRGWETFLKIIIHKKNFALPTFQPNWSRPGRTLINRKLIGFSNWHQPWEVKCTDQVSFSCNWNETQTLGCYLLGS